MIYISLSFIIFASPAGGNGLRRGATRERLLVTNGGLSKALKFDPVQQASSGVFSWIFFWYVLGLFSEISREK